MIILILINILCYWIYYTIRSNSYKEEIEWQGSKGKRITKKCPFPLWEAILVGLCIICPGGFVAMIFWLAMSSFAIFDVNEVKLSDKHILKRIYKFVTRDLAK